MFEMLARPRLWSSLSKKNALLKGYKPFLASLICFCMLISNGVFAQAAKKVTGKVTDEKGLALSGVSIKSKKSKNGTTTDVNGLYSISVVPDDILSVSYTAFETRDVKIGTGTAYNVQLKSSTEDLGEIIVVGYGSQKKSTLTGAISTVSGKTLNELPVASIDQALQGRVAGISVTNNGSPGSSPVIAIRGISSINGSGDPLYVIDGFPTGSLNTFDSKDIESVEVLKDASAAAIYGSRGTNGVILITTKKGKRTGKLDVTYDAYAGIQSPIKKLDLLNTTQYVQYATALLGGVANLPPRLQSANFNKPIYTGATQTFAQTNTNWQDEYFRNNQLINQHNISIAGGNNVSRFFTSAGYFKQNGIQQGLGYERGNFRINSDHKISKVFTFGQTLYVAFADQQYEGTGGNRSPSANVIRMQPYLPVRNPNNTGGFMGPVSSFDGSDPTNPVEPAILNQYHQQQFKILGSAYLEVNFTPWLSFRSTFGVDYSNNLNKQYIPIYNDSGTSNVTSATINHNRSLYTTLLYTQQLNFNKTFGDHHVGATVVFETQGQNASNYINSGNQDNNTIQTLNGATNISTNYTTSQNFIQSYVGRVTYSYREKYLFNVAMRRDGLSIWAPGHKYGNFPSASVGWRLDQERFMKNISQISELKLRAGYGLTGASPVSAFGNYPWQVVVNSNQSIYPFGGAIGGGFGSYINQLGNKDLFWETTKQFNIGMDLGLFRNKVTLVAEYFNRQTDNLILAVPTPASNGFDGAGVNANVGVMRNRGFEFQAAYHKTNGNFKWDVTGLFSVIRNKVLALSTPNASIGAGGDADFGGGANITNTVAGQPVQSFYGYVTDGIFQTQDQIAKSPTQNGAAPGDIKFKDLNGDGKITDADRTYIGSYLPKFTYSLNYSANYKSFDVAVFFQGVQGNKIFDGTRILTEGMVRLFNAGTAVLNAWTPTNTNTSMPRAINGDPNGNVRPSDRWIEDGSYLRLKNVMIGYNVPIAKLNSLTNGTITRIRLFISSQNLITFTKYKGWDPEIGTRRTTLTNGIDYGQYPSARSFQFGLQVGF